MQRRSGLTRSLIHREVSSGRRSVALLDRWGGLACHLKHVRCAGSKKTETPWIDSDSCEKGMSYLFYFESGG